MSTTQQSLRIVNSFQNTGPLVSKLDELLKLYKVPAMINDMMTYYFNYQIITNELNTAPATYGKLGTYYNLDISNISQIMSNSHGQESGKHVYEIALAEASISPDPDGFITLGGKYKPQTLYIRFQNFGKNTSYQWAINVGSNDRGHQVHYVFNDQVPNILNLQLGHVTVDANGNTVYYDFNEQIDADVRPSLPLFYNQQINVVTMRWYIRKIHIGF